MNTVVNASESLQNLFSTHRFGKFFGVPQHVFDRVWKNLTGENGDSVLYVSMEIGADPDVFHPLKDWLLVNNKTGSSDEEIKGIISKYLNGPRKIPNYSGGLGVLAGDTLKSFADTHIPVAAVSLLYREGYFSQYVDSKVGQIDQGTFWDPEKTPTLFALRDPVNQDLPLEISVPFYNEHDQVINARARIWMKMEINENLDYFVPEFLFDYAVPGSPPWIHETARRLYNATSPAMKANQRRMLGSGILPLMDVLGLTANTIHLNEQHGVVVTLQLIVRELQHTHGSEFIHHVSDEDILAAARKVSARIVYTIHTPVKAGHDRFNRSLYSGISHSICQRILNLLANDDDNPFEYNFTALAMRVNRAINSVSRLHRDVTRRQFPEAGDKITAITNGVHHLTWISDQRAALFDESKSLAGWREDPGVFGEVDLLKDKVFCKSLLNVWDRDNERLIRYINTMLSEHRSRRLETWIDPPNYLSHLPGDKGIMQPGVYTIGFARRFSTYKRADLIFDDIGALADILVKNNWAVNILYAGKAHPEDEPGKSVLKLILDSQEEFYKKSNGLGRLVFIPGYDMKIAKMMVAGVHSWLNSPKRPLEASGTSGMKAALNGVPNISVMDGWWVEGHHEGKTGWKFGFEGPVDEANLSEDPSTLLYAEDSDSFYALIPEILETYYENKDKYIAIAVNNLILNVPIFNTHRMAAEYVDRYKLKLDSKTNTKMKRFQQLYHSDYQD